MLYPPEQTMHGFSIKAIMQTSNYSHDPHSHNYIPRSSPSREADGFHHHLHEDDGNGASFIPSEGPSMEDDAVGQHGQGMDEPLDLAQTSKQGDGSYLDSDDDNFMDEDEEDDDIDIIQVDTDMNSSHGGGQHCLSSPLESSTVASHSEDSRESTHGNNDDGDSELASPSSQRGGDDKMFVETAPDSGKKLYRCSACKYVTDRKNNLKRHVVTMHEECQKALECCDQVFANKAAMREHVIACHKHGYDCKICGRNFCRKALLKRHITVHSGQKDYVCHVCGYATSHKSNLDRHKRRHLPKEGSPEKLPSLPPSHTLIGHHGKPVDQNNVESDRLALYLQDRYASFLDGKIHHPHASLERSRMRFPAVFPGHQLDHNRKWQSPFNLPPQPHNNQHPQVHHNHNFNQMRDGLFKPQAVSLNASLPILPQLHKSSTPGRPHPMQQNTSSPGRDFRVTSSHVSPPTGGLPNVRLTNVMTNTSQSNLCSPAKINVNVNELSPIDKMSDLHPPTSNSRRVSERDHQENLPEVDQFTYVVGDKEYLSYPLKKRKRLVPTLYTCKVCERIFTNQLHFNVHNDIHHVIRKPEPQRPLTLDVNKAQIALFH